MRVWGAGKLVAIGLSAVLLLAACSSSGNEPLAAPATTKPKPTTTDQKSADEAALRKLANDWALVSRELGNAPDLADPRVKQHLTGSMLKKFTKYLTERLRDHVAGREADPSQRNHWISRIKVSGDKASLTECFVDDGVTLDARTGDVVDDSVVTYDARTSAIRVGGEWKISDRSGTELTGVSGCALDH